MCTKCKRLFKGFRKLKNNGYFDATKNSPFLCKKCQKKEEVSPKEGEAKSEEISEEEEKKKEMEIKKDW